VVLRDDFFEHATTHMQRVANCIKSMAEIAIVLNELANKHKSLSPVLLQVVNIFENTGESVLLLQDDLLDMAKLVAPLLLTSTPPDTPSDTGGEIGSTPPSPSESTPDENQY
jgi:hypothetical protein